MGGGPAGSVAALNAAPSWSVVVMDRRPVPRPRIGESLAPAARRLLRKMELLESFLTEPHQTYHANVSLWGSVSAMETDFLGGLDGSGWHLDRRRFDQWLRQAAAARGARFLAPAKVESVERVGDEWRVEADTDGGARRIAARVIVDASGRVSLASRLLGASRRVLDRLICGWVYGTTEPGSDRGLTHVEGTEEGWWYTAPIPGERRVLAFHTDSDLPAAEVARRPDLLLDRMKGLEMIPGVLRACSFEPGRSTGVTAACTMRVDPWAGDAWLAAGDAALAVDPLSGQGLLNALYTGLMASRAAGRYLEGDPEAVPDYRRTVDELLRAYRKNLVRWYGVEDRWPESPFWARRRSSAGRATGGGPQEESTFSG